MLTFVCGFTNSLFVWCGWRESSVNQTRLHFMLSVEESTEVKLNLRSLGCLIERVVSVIHIADVAAPSFRLLQLGHVPIVNDFA